jgi:adenine-specific DNA-methyltransferase
LHKDESIKGASEKAEREFEKQYPAIYKHLLNHKEKLSARNKAETGIRYEWYALQRWASDYYQEFEKEKIIYPNMTLFLPFIYDDKKFYTNQKCFIITSKTVNLKFLVGYFNSKVSHRWIRENCPELQGGTRELSKIFFENIPIPLLSESEQKPFVALVEKILAGKERGEDTTGLEREIDEMVYRLYGLTAEEIAVVEGR